MAPTASWSRGTAGWWPKRYWNGTDATTAQETFSVTKSVTSTLVGTAWVEAATARPSQKLNAGYGYLWWVNHPGPIAGPLHITSEQSAAAGGQMAPGAPMDMYWARGLGGQVVRVDPGSDTVVVRLDPGDRSSTYSQTDTARVVTDALIEP